MWGQLLRQDLIYKDLMKTLFTLRFGNDLIAHSWGQQTFGPVQVVPRDLRPTPKGYYQLRYQGKKRYDCR